MKTIPETDLQPATAPGDGWYIIEAAGEHPSSLRSSYGVTGTEEEERTLVQRLTPEVLAAVAAAGVPAEGLPIDRDHLSLDADNSTEAMGWVRELAVCGGNLAARIEWTGLGLPLITGRVYKHFSTVYPAPSEEQLAAGVYEPAQLIGLALTNQPNNRTGQPPITNSGGVREDLRGTNYDVRIEKRGTLTLAGGSEAQATATARALGAVAQIDNRKSAFENRCNQYAHDPGCPDAEGGRAGTQDADSDDTADEMPEDADEELQERYMEAASMASAGADREEVYAVTGVDVGKTDIDREYEAMVAAGADDREIYKQTGIRRADYEQRRQKRRMNKHPRRVDQGANAAFERRKAQRAREAEVENRATDNFSAASANAQAELRRDKEAAGTKQTKNENTNMNELEDIKKALGLAPEATAADCVAAIESIKGEAAAAADSEAETLLNSEGLADLPEEEKKEIKEGLVTNRGLAMMTIRAYKERKQQAAAEPQQARYAKAGTPRTGVKPTGSVIINRAKEIQKAERAAGRTCSFWKAHGMAKNELNK